VRPSREPQNPSLVVPESRRPATKRIAGERPPKSIPAGDPTDHWVFTAAWTWAAAWDQTLVAA